MQSSAGNRIVLVAGVVLAACLPAGCQKKAETRMVSIAPADEQVASPQAVARAVLECLQQELRAIRAGDDQAVRAARGRLLGLAAQDEIRRMLAQSPQIEAVLGKGPAPYTGLWGATIAYYRDGLDLDALRPVATAEGPNKVDVLVPAVGAEHRATLRVRCARAADQKWRVWAVGFGSAPRGASAPASIPSP